MPGRKHCVQQCSIQFAGKYKTKRKIAIIFNEFRFTEKLLRLQTIAISSLHQDMPQNHCFTWN